MATNGFHVLIFFEARPGKSGRLSSLLTELVAPSLAEAGCRYYGPFADVQNPEKLTVIEAWDTPEQWQAHLQTSHVQKVLAALEAEQVLTQSFTAQQLRPLT
jgi:quinol monooxygenase YgiN